MPICKGTYTYYTGKEPSPKGLGFCAQTEKVGKRCRGKDGDMWMVHEDSIGRLYWKRIPSPKKCPEGKILNPSTNRCVSMHGKIGKKLLSGQRPSTPPPRPNPSRPPPRTPPPRPNPSRPSHTPRTKTVRIDSVEEFDNFLNTHAGDILNVLLTKYSKREFRLQFHPDRCISSSKSIHNLFDELGIDLHINVTYQLGCEAIYKKFSSLY